MFTVGQSPPISWANERQQQIQQPWIQEVAGNYRLGRFTNETPEERERRLEIQREQWRRRRQQETAEQREHRLAQRRQRHPQETEEQRNRRLEYQRQYQGTHRLHVNDLSNITLSNEGPSSHETPQQREHRLQRLEKIPLRDFKTKPMNRGNTDWKGSDKITPSEFRTKAMRRGNNDYKF